MYPTNGAAASLETFAAALGSGIEANLQSPQLIQPGMHDMRACWVKLTSGLNQLSKLKREEEEKKEESWRKRADFKTGGKGCVDGFCRPPYASASNFSGALLEREWETASYHIPIIRTDNFFHRIY